MTDPVFFADGPLAGITWQTHIYRREHRFDRGLATDARYMDTGERDENGSHIYREVKEA